MVSACMVVYNASQNIERCLNHISDCPFIYEIIVVDEDSGTSEIAAKYSKVKLLDDSFQKGSVVDLKNFALHQAKREWVLWIEPYELPEKRLLNDLWELVTQNFYDAYYFRWLNLVEKTAERIHQDYKCRLFKRGCYWSEDNEYLLIAQRVKRLEDYVILYDES